MESHDRGPRRCGAEMCPYWTGHGCACDVLGLDPTEAKAELDRWLDDVGGDG